MIGVYSAGMGIGASLSAGLVVPVMHAFHQSWNAALAIWSLFALVGSLYGFLLLKIKSITSCKGKTISQKSFTLGKSICLAADGDVWFAIGCLLFPSDMACAKVQDIGYSDGYAATTATIFSVMQMICSFIIPVIINNSVKRKPWLLLCALSSFIGILLLITGGVSYFLCHINGDWCRWIIPISDDPTFRCNDYPKGCK